MFDEAGHKLRLIKSYGGEVPSEANVYIEEVPDNYLDGGLGEHTIVFCNKCDFSVCWMCVEVGWQKIDKCEAV